MKCHPEPFFGTLSIVCEIHLLKRALIKNTIRKIKGSFLLCMQLETVGIDEKRKRIKEKKHSFISIAISTKTDNGSIIARYITLPQE